jgi:hypothetical protein
VTNRVLWLFFFAIALVSVSTLLGAQNRDYLDREPRNGACFFRDADFRGDRFCMESGDRMQQVPEGFSDKISSVRVYGRPDITVYQDRDFRGPSLRLRNDVANLQSFQVSPGHSWNDRISSIEIGGGRDDRDWDRDRDRDQDRDGNRNRDQGGDYPGRDRNRSGACFYKDADFRGEKFCVDRGERVASMPEGFRDSISSVQIFGRANVTVYQDSNFGGPSLRLRDDVTNLQSFQVRPGHSWNDRISSIKVY